MEEGWWPSWRSLEKHWIGRDLAAYRVWGYICANVSFKDRKIIKDGEIIEIKRGQLFVSLREMEKELPIKMSTINRKLKLLKNDRNIETQKKHRGQIITVCNFEKYFVGHKTSETQNETQKKRRRNTEETQMPDFSNVFEPVTDAKHLSIEALNTSGDLPGSPGPKETSTDRVFLSYSNAFKKVYNTLPKRNKTVDGQIRNLIGRLTETDAIDVMPFYLGHRHSDYVSAMHPIKLFLRDAEKLFAEWSSGNRVTRGLANRIDKIATEIEHGAEQKRLTW